MYRWEAQRITIEDLTNPTIIARNQRGAITPAQIQQIERMLDRLQADARRTMSSALSLLVVGGGMAGLGAYLVSLGDPLTSAIALWVGSITGGALLVAGMLLAGVRRSQHLRAATSADLAASRIAAGMGEVVWGRATNRALMYVMRIGERQLSLAADALPLPPGQYRCWYLEHSGCLLAAQATADHHVAAAHAAVIGQQHNFDAADLAANRSGHLSPRQRGDLRRSAWVSVGLGCLCLAGAAVTPFLPPDIGARRPLPANSLSFIPLLILLLVFATGLLFYARYQLRNAQAARPVRAAGGVLQVEYRRGYRSTTILYHLGGVTLEISRAMYGRYAYNSVIAGGRYRVYYHEHSRMLLSLEATEPPTKPPRQRS